MPFPLAATLLYLGIYGLQAWINSTNRSKGADAKSNFGDDATASGCPTIEQGNPVPVIWGTGLIENPQVIDLGQLYWSAGSGGRRFTYIATQLALCRGELESANGDGLMAMYLGGKLPAVITLEDFWAYATGPAGLLYVGEPVLNDEFVIDSPNLFGSASLSGGANFNCRIYGGADDQNGEAFRGRQYNYRGTALCRLFGGAGFDLYLPSIEFMVGRFPNNLALDDNGYKISGDGDGAYIYHSNPAEILYELMINADWGLGLTTDEVDDASFQTAGNTLFDESFGLSFQWNDRSSIGAIAQDILRAVGGILYVNATTGKISMRIIRAADASQLSLGSANLTECNMTASYAAAPTDSIVLDYIKHDPTGKARPQNSTVIINDPARFQWGGGYGQTKISYPFGMSADTAAKLAGRDFRIVSVPRREFEAVANREAYALKPGDVVELTWSDFDITALRCRVDGIDYGLLESGAIKLKLIEDVFDEQAGSVESPPSEWEEEDSDEVGFGLAFGKAFGGIP
jgi:hypothetical protein